MWGRPASLSIEPTTSCNLKCPECPSGLRDLKRPTGSISLEMFRKIIDESKKTLSYLMLYFQGEPFLHSDFFKMVEYAENSGIYTCTSTNGHFLDPEQAQKIIDSNLSQIIISMDGTDQGSYETYRKGGDYNKVIEGIRTLASTKVKNKSPRPYIIIQSLLFSSNEEERSEIKQLEKLAGINKVSFKTAQFYNFENGNPLMPKNESFSRYKKSDGKYILKQKQKNRCWKMWHSCVITWDGKVLPCCYDKHGEHEIGNISDQTLRNIWNSENYQSFRKKLFDRRKEIEICGNCAE